MKITIYHCETRAVLFEHTRPENSIRLTVEAAGRARVSLAYANLACRNLAGAKLRGMDFSHADLRGANLVYADACDANFAFADLRHVIAQHAMFDGACVAFTQFGFAVLSGAKLRKCHARGARFNDATRIGWDVAGTDLLHCKDV